MLMAVPNVEDGRPKECALIDLFAERLERSGEADDAKKYC